VRFSMSLLILLSILVSGCATTLAPHQPSVDAVTLLRSSGIQKLAVGDFKLASGSKASIDRSVTARAASASPAEGSFSAYLKASLVSDLKASGLYDTAAPLTVQGQLIDAQLDTGMSTGKAVISARFQVMRSGQSVFDKTLKDDHTWDSSFIGAVAIPRAINEYQAGYTNLLMQLYKDADFLSACRASP
jgi:hypothetical protein